MPPTSGKMLHAKLINQKNSTRTSLIPSQRRAPTVYLKSMSVDTFNMDNKNRVDCRTWPKNR